MKITIMSAFLCISTAAQAQVEPSPTTAPPQTAVQPQATPSAGVQSRSGALAQEIPLQPSDAHTGKIVMYRGSSLFGAGVACPIRYKGQEIVELARGKFAEWIVPAGRYILNNHTSSIEVSVDPGETRYVRCMIKMGMLAGRADLQIVDEESFNEHRNEYELKTIAAVPSSTAAATSQMPAH
jgi:hypothetical protein